METVEFRQVPPSDLFCDSSVNWCWEGVHLIQPPGLLLRDLEVEAQFWWVKWDSEGYSEPCILD